LRSIKAGLLRLLRVHSRHQLSQQTCMLDSAVNMAAVTMSLHEFEIRACLLAAQLAVLPCCRGNPNLRLMLGVAWD
jgi:hypothetical protein